MFSNNTRFQEFRAELEKLGVRMQFMWSTKRNPGDRKGYDDVAFVIFHGDGFRPRVVTAIVINYGDRDGFGLYTDADEIREHGNTFAEDAAMIAGPAADTAAT